MSQKNSRPLVAGGTIALAALVALSMATVAAYSTANAWVDHTLHVRHEADAWLIAVLGAEAQARGFALSGDAVFREPYEAALRDANAKGPVLRELVSDNPAQVANVDAAMKDQRAAFDRLAEIVALTEAGHTDDAHAYVASDESKRALGVLGDDLRRIVSEEERLLATRRARADANATFALSLGGVLVLVSAFSLALAFVTQRRRADELAALAESSRKRLDALGHFAALLADARTRDQVSQLVVEEGMRSVKADTCTLYMLDRSGTALELVGHAGVAKAVIDRIRKIGETSETGATFDMFKARKSLWVETGAEYDALFPSLGTMKTIGLRARAFWSLPLVVEGEGIGVLAMGFYEDRKFRPDERAFVETFVKQCAQALVRAARFEAADEARELFATTLHSIGDAVISTGPNGRITFMNAIAERLTGWPLDEARGRPLDAVFCILSETTRKVVENPVERVLREGVIVGLANHTILRSRRGAETPIDDSAAPIRDASGRLFGVVLVFRDVTIEKAEAVQREFLARAGEALVSSTDYRTTLATVARLAVPLLADWCAVEVLENGTPQQLAVAHVDPAKVTFAKVLGEQYPPDRNALTGVPQVLRSGKSELYPQIPTELLEAGAKDAEHLRLIRQLQLHSAMIVPLRLGTRVLGAMTFVHAESRRNYTESDLHFAEDFARRAAMAIDNATGVIALEVARERERALREQAEAASRAKDEFFAVVSHELRTPLNAILGWTVILRGRKLDAELDRPLAVIERNARAQAKLVEDVLDMARIISGKLVLNLAAVNVSEIARLAIESIAPMANAHAVKIAFDTRDESMTITADANRIQQVLWNLLTNAVKFTPAGGDVRVTAYKRDALVCVEVKDTGEGIRPDALSNLFVPFQQADASTTRRHGGLGLGLAIVRYIVTAHVGTVTATSDGEGKGSTFTVCLPVRSAVPAIEAKMTREHGASRLDGFRVLLVEDEDDSRMLVTTVLTEAGAHVDAFASAREALAKIATLKPDVLVSDIAMPDVDGYDLIRELRTRPSTEGGSTPAAALTAFARPEDIERAFSAGYQAHIVKPVEPTHVVNVVANLCVKSAE